MKAKNIIFGLGTGRCGTMSLSALLSAQNEANISHELGGLPHLSWERNPQMFQRFITTILERPASFIGDVSFYSLPYWKEIIDLGYNCRFIIIQRDREATIQSYLKKTSTENPFMTHHGTRWNHYDWDKCYPKFNTNSKEEAIGAYYDFYYEKCLEIPQDICFWLKTDELNDAHKSMEMLKFCGFQSPEYHQIIKNSLK